MVRLLLMTSLFFLIVIYCNAQKNDSFKWYKGNTHTHTTMSDGNETPNYVVNWYHERGYNFLILAEQNKFVDPDTVSMPKNLRENFILITGEEVTVERSIHTTALNISRYVHPGYEFNSKSEIIQSHADSIRAANGVPIYNHPNFGTGAQVTDILPVKRLHLLELYNGHLGINNFGYHSKNLTHIPVEVKWDSLLTCGMHIYDVAADDAHHYDEFYNRRANSGRGWVMIRRPVLSADAIVTAMQCGVFYALNGVIFKTVDATNDIYTLEIDLVATKEELKTATRLGHLTETEKLGYRIEFIGIGGKLLQSTEGTTASYKIQNEKRYVRARAVYCRKRANTEYEKIVA